MSNLKSYVVSGLVGLICALILLSGWLWLLDLAYANDTSKVIMAAAIGLTGAIVGGVISGSLTLAGVYLTISHERKAKLVESYPMRRRNADMVEFKISSLVLGSMSLVLKRNQGYYALNQDIVQDSLIILDEEKEEILDLATKVDGYFFSRVSEILINCSYIKMTLSLIRTLKDKEDIKHANNDIDKMATDNIRMTKELLTYIQNMEKEVL